MANVEKLVVELDAKIDGYTREMQKVNKQTKSTSKSTDGLKTAVGALVAAISVREFQEYADTWKNIQNQLRVVTTGTKDLANTTGALMNIANDTRSSFESTAQLYARMARATADLDISQTDLLDVTQTINKAFTLSGATTTEAAASITQLSQALASGTLRGDEFNSIAEQSPVILEAVSKFLGVTRGELRALAAEGKITSEVLISSVLAYKNTVDTQFGGASATMSQAFEVMSNSTLQFIGEFDNAIGLTDSLADSLIDMSSDTVTTANNAAMLAAQIKALGASWSSTFDQMTDSSASFNTELEGVKVSAQAVGEFLRDAFVNLPANVKASIEIAVAELLGLFSTVMSEIEIFGLEAEKAFENIKPEMFQGDGVIEGLDAQIDKERELQAVRKGAHDEFITGVFERRDASINAGQEVIDTEIEAAEIRAEQREEFSESEEEKTERSAERETRLADHSKKARSDLSKLTLKQISTELKAEKAAEAQKIQLARQGFSAAMSVNRAFFNDNKNVKAGLIVMDTAAAAMKAYSESGPVGAVIAIAAGAAQLKNLKSASIGGGSIGGGGSGGASQSQSTPQSQQPAITDNLTSVNVTSIGEDDFTGSFGTTVNFNADSGGLAEQAIGAILNDMAAKGAITFKDR